MTIPAADRFQDRTASAEARLRATLDSLLDPHLVLTAIRDESGTIVDFRYDDANEAACTYFRMTRQQLIGSRLLDLYPGLVGAGLMARYADVITTSEPLILEDAPYLNEILGQERFYDVHAVRMGEQLVFTLRDVTDRHHSVTLLADSEQRYRLLVENAWDVIWTMELDGSISYISPSVERIRGLTPAEAMAQTPDQIQPPDTVAKGAEYYDRLFAAIDNGTEPPSYHGEQEYYRKDGSIMLGEVHVIPQVDASGQVLRILGVTRDISDRRRFEEELNRLAITDPLTGVWNRRQGERLFSADVAEARRYGPPLSLLMIDIDHFKSINDTYGHQTGDHVLVEFARRLERNLRTSDALARWGGDEFVVVMRHCTLNEALPLADKLRGLMAKTPFDEVGTVTASIGAAELRADDDLGSWLRRADQAMYDAKSAGRNSVQAAQSA